MKYIYFLFLMHDLTTDIGPYFAVAYLGWGDPEDSRTAISMK